MKKISLILSLAALTFITVFSSCRFGCVKGSGHQNTETRKLGSFNKIDIEGGFKVVLNQDSSEAIAITADDNLLKYIHTSVNDGRLHIYTRKNMCNRGPMLITIGVRNLELLKGAGAVEFTAVNKLNVQDLHMDLSGASRVTLALNAANVVTEGSGATELHLSGQASSHKITLTGSGKVFAYDFVVGDYNLKSTGASEVQINVLHSLKINTTGASEIKYKGNPTTIQNDKAGASSITKVD